IWSQAGERRASTIPTPATVMDVVEELFSSTPNQPVERLCDGPPLIRPHARAGERDHATDGGDALGLGLEHHQVERLLVMAARAASHQEGSGDALELSRRNICAGVALHALNRALNLRRLHRHSHPKTP